jgi:WD40 repeat protein
VYGSVVTLRNVSTGTLASGPFRDREMPAQLIDVAFDPAGRFVAAGGADGNVRIWDLQSGRLVRRLEGTGPVGRVEFRPDGRTLAGGGDGGGVRVWTGPAWRPGPDLLGQFFIADTAFSPDGRILATAGSDGLVRWDVRSGDRIGAPLRGHEGEVRSVAFSPDGNLMATGGSDGTVRLWDPVAGVQVGQAIEGHDDSIGWVEFTRDGSGIVVAPGDSIMVHSVDGVLGVTVGSEDNTSAIVDVSPDGSILAVGGGPEGWVDLLDPATGAPVGPALEQERNAWAIDFAPDGTLAASDGPLVRIWDPTTGTQVTQPLSGQSGGNVWGLAFSPDGTILAVATAHKTIVLWGTDTWEPVGVIQAFEAGPASWVRFSPDGSTLYATGHYFSTMVRWDVETREQLGEPVPAGFPMRFEVSPSTGLVAIAGQFQPLTLYDADLEPLPAFETDVGRASSTAFTPDGRILALGGDDGTVRLFDVESGEQLGSPLGAHSDWTISVAFSPDGTKLVSGGQDGTVRIWDSALWADDLEEFRAALCPIAARSLTPEEWETFLPDEPYAATCDPA